MNCDRLWNPFHFWEDNSRLTGVPNRSLCQKIYNICSHPISADPICPFPRYLALQGDIHVGTTICKPNTYLLELLAIAIKQQVSVGLSIRFAGADVTKARTTISKESNCCVS